MTQIPPVPPAPGATLKALREARGLTQQALADKLGKSRTAVAAWEYGRAMSLKSRAAVAKLLKVQPDELGPPWNPNGARPQYRRRQREETAYMEKLLALGAAGAAPITEDDGDAEGDTATAPARPVVSADTPDAEQFAKVAMFWRMMPPARRAQLVKVAWEFASPDVGTVPTTTAPDMPERAREKKARG